MANKPLTEEALMAILQADEAEKKTKRTRGPKVDPTEDRAVTTWIRLNHHLCMSTCEHRTEEANSTGNACWNPDCQDPRNKETDRGANMVTLVKGVYMCRYCFLAGWMK